MRSLPSAAFASFVVLQAIVWSRGRYAHVGQLSSPSPAQWSNLVKRGELALFSQEKPAEDECSPLSFPVGEQCSHVLSSCTTSDTVLSIPYLKHYFCSSPQARPFVFAGLIVWLIFLFSTLGISASDFFCPNLASIADMLGLDESVAGVTFLAFGNGSPDVFSTFSAMRADSGSLAIGELLGAASFIVSVVVGSLCIIKPFKVDRRPFLRDVGFFTIAVSLLILILWDSIVHAWEAALLVGLYVLYVLVVVIGTWWERRKRRRRDLEAIVRSEYADGELPEPSLFEPYADSTDQVHLQLPSPTTPRIRAHSNPESPSHHLRVDTQNVRHLGQLSHSPSGSRSSSPSSPRLSAMPSFSLVGALEFRQVITSLQSQSSGSTLDIFDAPLTPYAGGHYHSRSRRNSRHIRQSSGPTPSSLYERNAEIDPWDAALGQSMQLSQTRSPAQQILSLPLAAQSAPATQTLEASHSREPSSPMRTPTGVPRIETTPASPMTDTTLDDDRTYSEPTRWQRIVHTLWHVQHVLFPTLSNLGSKSVLGILASVLAAPAVFALTVTLPVHVTMRHNVHPSEKHEGGRISLAGPENSIGGGIMDFEEEGIERILTAEDEVESEMHELKFNKWLMAVQCILGPFFCAAVLFAGTDRELWVLGGVLVLGIAAAGLVLAFADHADDGPAQMARCFMGFFVAVMWIMAIADEVVNVLLTFGFIFGLSDAIIGLTIFAVGNSLADFVANISVAAFAPAMGFAACFGGPMLNILLGVGISGSYIIHASGKPYYMHFSTTLFVSTVGLLALLVATMLFIPWNGFYLPRRWGFFLIAGYVVIMVVNVLTEVNRHATS